MLTSRKRESVEESAIYLEKAKHGKAAPRRREPHRITDTLGALKWFFHVQLHNHDSSNNTSSVRRTDSHSGNNLNSKTQRPKIVSVHWEGSVKLFIKIPMTNPVVASTYSDPQVLQEAADEWGSF